MAALVVISLTTACHSHDGHDDHDGHDHAAHTDNHDDHAGEHAEGEAEPHAAASDAHDHGGDEIEFTDAQAKAAGLKLETVTPAPFAEVVRVSGRIMPAQGAEATVTATMAGIVNFSAGALNVGRPVAAGQSLFTINAKSMSNGNPAAAAQAELTAAKKAVERARRLAADNLISSAELEAAEQRYATAVTTAQSSGSNLRPAVAPIPGYIKEVLVQRGAYVEAGQALATVTQNRRLQLQADVPERHYAVLPRIVSANFRPAYAGEQTYSLKALQGKLAAKGQTNTTGDYFVPVTFEFGNAPGIVPGSLAEVFLIGGERANVITVPCAAIAESMGLYFVYVEVHKNMYVRREVKLGATDGLRTEVTDGLKQGEKVVVSGTTQVRLAANKTAIPAGHSH